VTTFDLTPEGLRVLLAVHDRDRLVALCRDLHSEIGNLANYIMGHVPGEPSENQGVADTAIRIMTTLQARVWVLEKLAKDISEDMACLPSCNSFAHDDICPFAHPALAWRTLRQQLADVKARLIWWRDRWTSEQAHMRKLEANPHG